MKVAVHKLLPGDMINIVDMDRVDSKGKYVRYTATVVSCAPMMICGKIDYNYSDVLTADCRRYRWDSLTQTEVLNR